MKDGIPFGGARLGGSGNNSPAATASRYVTEEPVDTASEVVTEG